MSWKALIIGDLHWTGHQPVARKDDLRATLWEKLRECWGIAEKHQVDAIIQTGDLTHTPHLTLPVLAGLVGVLRRFAPVPIYSVPGNHDALSPATVGRTPFGFLRELDLIRDVADRPIYLGGTPPIYITGRAYDADVDSAPEWYAVQEPKIPRQLRESCAPSLIHIHVAHGMLVDHPRPSRHTLLRDLELVEHLPDVLITGHDHLGYGIKRVGRTLCINPGALVRLTAAVEEMERPVQVALMEIHQGKIEAQLIPLESARPGREVLSREHLEAQAAREARREEFLELLAAETQEQVLSLEEMIRDIARRERIPAEVRDSALELIAKAQEEVAAR